MASDPLYIEVQTPAEIAQCWSPVVGLNPPIIQVTFFDPITRRQIELKEPKEPFVWNLEKNITHRQLASLVINIINVGKCKDHNPPTLMLEFNGGYWIACGSEGHYRCTLTLGIGENAAVWDFTINFN